MGDEIHLMNLRFTKQKLAVGRISSLGGVDMFHYLPIPSSCYRIDVTQVLQPNVPLMFENKDAEQFVLKDVKGENTIWDLEYIQFTSS